MIKKILIPLYLNDVAPRFDQATEAFIVAVGRDGEVVDEKMVVLPQASAEELCHLILTDGVQVIICGGIEEEFYQYLTWKRVQVIDSVIGPYPDALRRFLDAELKSGDILASARNQ